jgi:hypothetical protein
MDLADAYRIFHPISAQHTFFLAGHITGTKQASANIRKSK